MQYVIEYVIDYAGKQREGHVSMSGEHPPKAADIIKVFIDGLAVPMRIDVVTFGKANYGVQHVKVVGWAET
jgi:hypothetical protein